jgi:mannose-6-phosphate isomerase-like protein (cupin superfamily)
VKNSMLWFALAACLVITPSLMGQAKINPTDPQPTCNMCPGTYLPVSELEAYTKKAIAENLLDQQVRDIEIGKAHIGIGMVHRGKLDKPAPDSVAEHDQVSEVYHIVSGTATLVLGPDIVNRQRRPATQRTVVEFNGPGNNGSDIRNGVAYQLKPGDVVVIPAGTGHWFTKIDDHIDWFASIQIRSRRLKVRRSRRSTCRSRHRDRFAAVVGRLSQQVASDKSVSGQLPVADQPVAKRFDGAMCVSRTNLRIMP